MIPKKYFKITLLFFFIVLLYFFYLIYRPFGFSKEISVIFGENDVEERNSDFYLKQNYIDLGKVSPQMIENNISYRNLYGTAAEFLLHPKRYPPDINKLKFALDFRGHGADLYGILPCAECQEALPQIPLYLDGLEDFETKEQVLYGEYPVFFYSDDFADKAFIESVSVESWINANLSSGTSLLITEELLNSLDFEAIANKSLSYDSSANTTLQAIFYGNQQFYIQSGKNLNLSFDKTNMNHLEGEDGLVVQILNLNNELMAERMFDDDGIIDAGNKTTEQSFSVSFNLPYDGVYKIFFKPLGNMDFELKKITFNTDKIVFDEALINGDNSFFTRLNSVGHLQMIPHEKILTTVKIISEDSEKSVSFNQYQAINQTKNIDLEKGDYLVETKGSLALDNAFFSQNAENFFLPYHVELRTNGISDSVLTRMDLYKKEGGLIHGENYFIRDELGLLGVQKELKSLPFYLALKFPSVPDSIYKILSNNSYNSVGDFCGLTIYSVFETSKNGTEDIECTKNSIIDAIKRNIPLHSGVVFNTDIVSSSDFYSLSGIDDYVADFQTYNPHVQGNSEFALYVKGDLDLDISKTDFNNEVGDDEVLVEIQDENRKVIYTSSLEDDGDTSNGQVPSIIERNIQLKYLNGLFYLRFVSMNPASNNDFGIESISLNSNKLMLLNRGNFYENTKLFFMYTGDPLSFSSKAPSNKIKKIKFNDEYTKPTNAGAKYYEDGMNVIETSGQLLTIADNNFYFAEDGYFDYSYYNTDSADYLISEYLGSYNFSLFDLFISY